MIHALIDTNVILDVVANRRDFVDVSRKIFEKLNERKFIGYISATSIKDIYYLIRKECGKETAKMSTQKMGRILDILPVTRRIVEAAFVSPVKDFEDAIQVETARAGKVTVIVTRNSSDFVNCGLDVFEPTDFLNQLNL